MQIYNFFVIDCLGDGVYYKVHYYALYVLVPQVLSSIACAVIAVQEESVHPLNLESRLNNLIP